MQMKRTLALNGIVRDRARGLFTNAQRGSTIMMRMFGVVIAFVGLFAALALAPTTRGFDEDSHATPGASPEAMHGDGEMSMSGNGAAYMIIRNAGEEPDRLIAGKTDVAEVVEIHEIVDVEGMMEMRPLADGLEIPAGGEVTLQPGGYHVMLIGLTEDLTNGMTFDLTLEFAEVGEITVPITVRPRAEADDDATPAAPVVVGEITIDGAWSRPAPAMGAMATPEA